MARRRYINRANDVQDLYLKFARGTNSELELEVLCVVKSYGMKVG